MDDHNAVPDERIFPILRRYAAGEVSAYNAACEVQDLGLPEYPDPNAGDVVVWSKAAGFGIPSPSEEEARAEAQAVLDRERKDRDRQSQSGGGRD